jgi:predicted  nucleic acid-binding Zn-ribbon protein
MSAEDSAKLAEVLAIMQRLSETEQTAVLPQKEVIKKAEIVAEQLPEKPTDILLKFIRNKQESKIENAKENIKNLKNKISKRSLQSKKFGRKVVSLTAEMQKFKTANAFLNDLESDSTIKDFIISKNNSQIEKLQAKIDKLEDKISKNSDKILDFDNKISEENKNIEKFQEKIIRINEAEQYPNSAIMFFLAEKFGVGEKAIDEPILISENLIELADEILGSENLQEIFIDEGEALNNRLNSADYQAEIKELAIRLGASFDDVNNALAREFQSQDSFPINSKYGEIKFKLYPNTGGFMLDMIFTNDTFFNEKNDKLSVSYCFKSEEKKELNLLRGLNFEINSDVKDGKLKTDAIIGGSLSANVETIKNPKTPTPENELEGLDEGSKFLAQHLLLAKLFLVNNEKSISENSTYTVYLRHNYEEANFEKLVESLVKIGDDEDVADCTAMKMAMSDEYKKYLKIPEEYKGAEKIVGVKSETQFVPPPNFEYEEQPVNAVPYTAPSENSDLKTAENPPVKKENDELNQHDPNAKQTPEKLGKIEINKEDFLKMKPKLQELKEKGLFVRVFEDKKKPDNIKIFFDKKDKETFQKALPKAENTVLKQ